MLAWEVFVRWTPDTPEHIWMVIERKLNGFWWRLGNTTDRDENPKKSLSADENCFIQEEKRLSGFGDDFRTVFKGENQFYEFSPGLCWDRNSSLNKRHVIEWSSQRKFDGIRFTVIDSVLEWGWDDWQQVGRNIFLGKNTFPVGLQVIHPPVAKRCLVRSLFLYFSVHRWLPRYSHLTRVSILYSVCIPEVWQGTSKRSKFSWILYWHVWSI